MGYRGPLSMLVGRRTRDDEPDLIQPARLAALLGQDQVPHVNWVEGAAVKPQSHEM
jgi:hypothetical protein